MSKCKKKYTVSNSKALSGVLLLGAVLFTILVPTGCYKNVCEEGFTDQLTVERTPGEFNQFTSYTPLAITLKADTLQQIVVTAPVNLHNFLSNRINRGELEFGRYTVLPACAEEKPITITGQTTPLKGVSVLGKGVLACEDICADTVDLMVGYSGQLFFSVPHSTNKLTVTIDSTSVAGNLHAFNVQSRVCRTWIKGQGTIEVSVSDSLYVNINSSGTVLYKGNPVIVIESQTGSGEVKPAN